MPHRRRTTPPTPPKPVFNPATQAYSRGNRGITPRRLVDARNTAVNNSMAGVNNLAVRLDAGKIDVQAWLTGMREQVKDAYTQQYLLGRGGRNMMTQADWGSLGNMLREQYQYLNRFAAEIAQGKLSMAQIQMRSKMYIDSAVEAYERARAHGRGLQLPAYPGDGKTPCRVRCKCHWRIVRAQNGWACYWTLGIAEHCPGCLENASRWNPIILPGSPVIWPRGV